MRPIHDNYNCVWRCSGLPRLLSAQGFACNAGDAGLIPRTGRSPGEGNYSSILAGHSIDRGTWRATVQGTVKQLNMT